jgi:hypothetical protein
MMMPPARASGQHPFPRTMKNPYRGGKVHKRARFGDISIKDTVKEQQTRLGRQQFARRKAEAAIAVAEI